MVDLPKDLNKPHTQNQNSSRAALIITGDHVEDLEFFYPYFRFIEAGVRVDVATADGGAFKGKHGIELKDSLKLSDVNPDNYQLLYLPGGKAPAKLRKNDEVLRLTKRFAESNKIISAICHGPQILAAADVIRGRKIAAWPEIEDELMEAGATIVNKETVIDGCFITARWPADLPMHMKWTLEVLDRASLSDLRLVS